MVILYEVNQTKKTEVEQVGENSLLWKKKRDGENG